VIVGAEPVLGRRVLELGPNLALLEIFRMIGVLDPYEGVGERLLVQIFAERRVGPEELLIGIVASDKWGEDGGEEREANKEQSERAEGPAHEETPALDASPDRP
jgi:hypothetical protein